VGTTAGLGIFWVANQQLPAFDWHYLFAYATVLLLAVHLGLNFRIVWRHWVERRAAARQPAAPERSARRSMLGALGLLAATGAAFWFGLRHGRTELHFEAGRSRRIPAGSGSCCRRRGMRPRRCPRSTAPRSRPCCGMPLP
jgi:hypothetical protein